MSRFLSSILKKIKGPEEPPKPQEPVNIQALIFSYTNRLVLIPFPSPEIIEPLHKYISTEYNRYYKIWNLSEYNYENDLLSGKCVEFLYQGYPVPHLSTFFSIFESIRVWLGIDPRNVALIHCQSTKARSVLTLAGYLLWSKEESDILEAVRKILKLTRLEVEFLPSQKRYLGYIQQVITGPVPQARSVRIRKVLLEGIPLIEKTGTAVRPYLQIFKNSELVFNSHSQEYPPVSYELGDDCIVFELDLQVEEDLVVRCRHLGRDGQASTIFRVMFHTAFTENEIITFSKSELDGAYNDERFPDTFKLDFFLESNTVLNDSKFFESILRYPDQDRVQEEVKSRSIEKHESDEELDNYFKQLEKQ